MNNEKEMQERIAKEMKDEPEDIFQDELVKYYQNEFLDDEMISSLDEAARELKEPVPELDSIYPETVNFENVREPVTADIDVLIEQTEPELSATVEATVEATADAIAEAPEKAIIEVESKQPQIDTQKKEYPDPTITENSTPFSTHFSALWNIMVLSLLLVLGWEYYENSTTIHNLKTQIDKPVMTTAVINQADHFPVENDAMTIEQPAADMPQSAPQHEEFVGEIKPEIKAEIKAEIKPEIKEQPVVEVAPQQAISETADQNISTPQPQAEPVPHNRGKWVINLLSYKSNIHAQEAANELESSGVENVEVIHVVTGKINNWYRVRIYGFKTYASAKDYFYSNQKRLHANSPWIDLYEKR